MERIGENEDFFFIIDMCKVRWRFKNGKTVSKNQELNRRVW